MMNVSMRAATRKDHTILSHLLRGASAATLIKNSIVCRLLLSTKLHTKATDYHHIGASEAADTPYRGPCMISGWIKSARHQKKYSFVHIIDGLSSKHVQVVLPAELMSDPSQLRFGASVKAAGMLIDSPGSAQAVELQAESINVLGDNNSDSYPFAVNTKSYTAEYTRQFLHLRSRQPEFAAMLRLRSACKKAIHDYFSANNYVYIDTPVLTSNDCEGAGETFIVDSDVHRKKEKRYFGDNKTVNLTVSGQLHLEACNAGISKVYTFGPTFRADNAVDRTHLAEFYMLEGEIAFIQGLQDLMDFVEDLTKTVGCGILDNEQENIASALQGSTRFESTDAYQHLSKPFHRITYAEALTLLQSSSKVFKKPPVYGEDIQREHEHYILQAHGFTPVFVTNWPKKLKPFYMYLNCDEETVACMDLLVPGPGELFGGSVREWRHDKLKETLHEKGMLDEYDWYLDIRRFGSAPHAGFGMGFERFLQFLFGVKQIRDTIPFPRYANNCRL